MDFDFDLDDLGDLEDLDDLECDWELPTDPSSPQTQEEQKNQHNQQLNKHQEQQACQPQHEESCQSPDSGGMSNDSDNIGPIQKQQSAPVIDAPIATPTPTNTTNDAAAVFQIRLDRERDGRCADCGAQTHEVQFDPSGSGRSIKVPLSVPEEVHRGRCLFCHPLPTSHVNASSTRRRTIDSHSGELNNNIGTPSLRKKQELQQQAQHHMCSSSASVCTATSQQSSHSIFSQQSAPLWAGEGQNIRPNNGFSSDLMENYQQQQQFLQMQKQMQRQQQQQQYPDDGSVYSQASHQSHHSIHSQTSYHSFNQQLLASPQLNPTNIETQFQRSNATNSHNNNPNSDAAAEIIYLQMQEAGQLGNGNLDIENCLQALNQFPAHGPLQELGCTLLYAQTNNNTATNGSWRQAVPTILESMRNHPCRPNLQRASCETLRKLCNSPFHRQLLIQKGGVPLIVKMMSQNIDDPDMQRGGCAALASIAEGGMEYKISVAESGGILAVMKAVEIHPDNNLLLRAAYQALRMLGYNPGGKSG